MRKLGLAQRFALVVGGLLVGAAALALLLAALFTVQGAGAASLVLFGGAAVVALSLAANLFILVSIDRKLDRSP